MRRQELHPRTAVLNKTQKNLSKKTRQEALKWLAATFPHIFDNTLKIQPLKNGIMEDILKYADKAAEQGISKSKLREAVVLFTRRIDYLTCLKAREIRVDLEGQPDVMVTDEEADKANTKIKKRIEKSVRNAKKAAAPRIATYTKTEKSFAWTPSPAMGTNPHHIERQPVMYNTQPSIPTPAKPAVIVRHKTVRQYDPEAVARLKEKLGLSRKEEATEE